MKIGNYLVPDMRLDELLANTLKKIYTQFHNDPIQSKDLAGLLGYKYGTEPTLFKKIHSMLSYGILEGRGVYNVTKLGVDLLYPENLELEKQLKTKAIMNVELWKKLYEKHGKEPPKDSLWISIKTIMGVDPETAKTYANRIYKWYVDDIALISKEYIVLDQEISKEEPIRSNVPKSPPMGKESPPQSLETQTIPFANKYSITVPKGDLKIEWAKLVKYMNLYLEDYKNDSEKQPSE